MPPLEYLSPLLCGFIYAVGTLLSKRAFSGGVGVARTLFLFNWIQFIFFLPFLIWVDETPNWDQWQWPLLAGMLFFFGQLTTFGAIRVGDVSVQSPVMGAKMVFVAAFAALLGAGNIPVTWWAGAFLSMIGVILLSMNKIEKRGNTWLAIFLALLSAASFGLCDVLVSQHARSFSIQVFPIAMMGVNAFLSFAVIPFFKGGYGAIERSVWKWFIAAGFVLSTQGTLLYLTLSYFGKATAVNILYSSRGIWSVALVWAFGAWIGNTESHEAGKGIMLRRLIGATLMLGAIFLVLWSPNVSTQ